MEITKTIRCIGLTKRKLELLNREYDSTILMEKWEFILQRISKEKELIERLTITYPLVIRDLMDIQN